MALESFSSHHHNVLTHNVAGFSAMFSGVLYCLNEEEEEYTPSRWVDDDHHCWVKRLESSCKTLYFPLFFISIQFDNWKTFRSSLHTFALHNNDSFEPQIIFFHKNQN